MAFCSKEASKGLDHLMHAIGVGREKASDPYPFGYDVKGGREKTKQGVLS